MRQLTWYNAIDLVRDGPDHSAVMNARVVGVSHTRRKAAPGGEPRPRSTLSARRRRAGTPAPTATRRSSASSCARNGHRAHRYKAPTQRGRVSIPPRRGRAPNAVPIVGRATLATAKFRFATAATRMSEVRTRPGRWGPDDDPSDRVAPVLCFPVPLMSRIPLTRCVPGRRRDAWPSVARHRRR